MPADAPATPTASTPAVRLGLIGGNIAASQAPILHELAGDLAGLDVTYERLVPKEMGQDFDAVFAGCRDGGYRGVNVTYPYKELAAAQVRVDDPLVRAIGAVNTVLFDTDPPSGHNTDYSGFVAAYKSVRGAKPTGPVCLVGAGGVGKAVAFGLVALGAPEVRLVDQNPATAAGLAAALTGVAPDMAVRVADDVQTGVRGAAGLVNGTPLGMVGYPGSAFPDAALDGAEWVFDAVYTPTRTAFLQAAEARGLEIVSGYELFFNQGVQAAELFLGRAVDAAALRRGLPPPPSGDA